MILPLDPLEYLGRFQFTWDPGPDGGGPVDNFARLPWFGYFALSSFVGLSLDLSVRVFYVVSFFAGGASMYLLFSTLVPGSRIAGIIAAIFYMFNPFVLSQIQQPPILLMYSMIPLSLFAFHKSIYSKRRNFFILLTVASLSLSFVGFPSFSWPIIVAGLLGSYLVFGIVRKSRINYGNLILLVVLFFGVNFWWISPTIQDIGTFSSSLADFPIFPEGQRYNQISRVLIGLGHWGLYGSAGDLRFFVPGDTYLESPAVILSLSLLVVISFSSLILPGRRSLKLFFAGLGILVIFLAKGTNPPFGGLYSWLLANVLPFKAFRVPTQNLASLLMLAYAFLLGTFVFDLRSLATKRFSRLVRTRMTSPIIVLPILGLILLGSFPLFSGTAMINWYNFPNKGVTIPDSYAEANDWLNDRNDVFRVLIYPSSGTYMATNWGYQGANFYNFWFDQRLFVASSRSYQTGAAFSLANDIYGELYSEEPENLGPLLSMLGINYLLFDRSINPELYNLPSVTALETSVLEQGMLKIKDFDGLSIYQNESPPFPSIYATTESIIFDASPDAPSDVIYEDNFSEGWDSVGGIFSVANEAQMNLESEGTYTFSSIKKFINFNSDSRHLIVEFKTNSHTGILVSININGTENFLVASNPTSSRINNHYVSLDWYSLSYRLPSELSPTPHAVTIYLTNLIDTTYQGFLELDLRQVRVAQAVGTLGDLSNIISERKIGSFVIFHGEDIDQAVLNSVPNSVESPVRLHHQEINPTLYRLHVEASQPFFLVFSEGFNNNWGAFLEGEELQNHLEGNLFANTWLVPRVGEYDIVIRYKPQLAFELGQLVSVLTVLGSAVFFSKSRIPGIGRRWSRKRATS